VSGKHNETEEFAKIAQLSPKFPSVDKVWARQEVNRPTGEIFGKIIQYLLSFNL